MPISQQFKEEILVLPQRDRADLVLFLLESLDTEEDADAETAWPDELQRREREIRNGEVPGEPADEVMKRLREKHS